MTLTNAHRTTRLNVLIEPQAYDDKGLARRIAEYTFRLWKKYNLAVLPIVVISYQQVKPVEDSFRIGFELFTSFHSYFKVIQLHHYHWRDYIDRANPVACALAAKMKIAKRDRPKAKAAIMLQLSGLGLNPAQVQLIGGFVDTYLNLSEAEQAEFDKEVGKFKPEEQKAVLDLTTSWEHKGKTEMLLELIEYRFGALTSSEQSQIRQLAPNQVEALAKALFDFLSKTDLTNWLQSD